MVRQNIVWVFCIASDCRIVYGQCNSSEPSKQYNGHYNAARTIEFE